MSSFVNPKKNSTIIEERLDHKGRGKQTIIIAALVEINGVRINIAVVVVKGKGNHYYAHRILMPDGAVLSFSSAKKQEARREPQRGVTENSSLANATSLAFKTIIQQTAEKVNTSFENNTTTEAIFAIYSPDLVESLFSTAKNPTERQSFTYAKNPPTATTLL